MALKDGVDVSFFINEKYIHNNNIMELTRTIHPVGQGGFYTESLKDDNFNESLVAYDCGGSSELFMKKYLSRFIEENKRGSKGRLKIDAIFISHLHADHINGLKYLLNNAYVRYLFLPQLTDEMLIETLSFNSFQDNVNVQNLTDFILDIYRREGNQSYGETRIVEVAPSEDQGSIDGFDIVDISNNVIPSPIKTGTAITSASNSVWLYIPYNPPVRQGKEAFSSYLERELGLERISPKGMPDIVKKYEKEIKKCYANYFKGNHNSYSMPLFSGIRGPSDYKIRGWYHVWDCSCNTRFHLRRESANCLYTGDFEARAYFHAMSQFYGPLWPTIKSIQVPHHGSKNNIHPSLYDNAIRGFISVGTGNRYNHPSKDILIELYRQRCLPIVVTEDEWTKFVSCYSF